MTDKYTMAVAFTVGVAIGIGMSVGFSGVRWLRNKWYGYIPIHPVGVEPHE